ncbi:MAG: hypothetical protein V4664_04140 [Patescibacteria group bacterium]
MKNSQKGFVIPLVIAIVALFFISGGAYVYLNKTSNNPSLDQNDNNLTAVQKSESTAGTTTDRVSWKVYSNMSYGFQLTYPENWKINDQSFTYQGNKKALIEIEGPVRNVQSYNLTNVRLSLSVSFEDGIKKLGYIGLVKVKMPGDQAVTRVELSSLDLIAADGEDYNIATKIFDSVKLISTETSASKIYTNEKYGFSIEHPSETQISDTDISGGRSISFTTPQGTLAVQVVTLAWNNGVLSSPPNCNDTAGGQERTITKINGNDFLTFNMSKELSGRYSNVSATEYCLVKGETAYKIITRVDYTAGSSNGIDLDKNAVLNQMLSSFKFIPKVSLTSPSIASISPASVPLLSSLTINGSNLDPLGGYSGIGWLTHSHVFVKITNSIGQTGILWEGGSQGGNTSTANTIVVSGIPRNICTVSEVDRGECPSNSSMSITPGQYTLTVIVHGRGTSNSAPLTIINGVQ